MSTFARGCTSILLLFIAFGPTLATDASAQSDLPAGYAMRDITAGSGCAITVAEHATKDLGSDVISQWVESCPAGSVIETTSVNSEAEAVELGAVFIPSTGDPAADEAALREVKNRMAPAPDLEFQAEQQLSGCTFLQKSKTMQFQAYVENVTVYSTAYYWRDVDCSQGVSSGAARISANRSKMKWVYMVYSPPYFTDSHGCAQLSTTNASDWYGKSVELGGTYQDEARSTAHPCSTGYGTSYTQTMVLN